MSSFPRQHARTRRFSLGVPRGLVAGVGPDGPLVLFLRSDAGDDPVNHLWRHDPVTGRSEKLVDARVLGDEGELPLEERARRERAREQAGGIVSFAVDDGMRLATFTLAGRLHTVDLGARSTATQPTDAPAFDPRPAPDAHAVAYHAADGLHLVDLLDGPARPGRTRVLVTEPDVGWGRAEFIAAEEMGRSRGFWWSGDGTALAVTRVDERAVPLWTIADPANPWTTPSSHRYPAAGTTNAEVGLWVVEAASGDRIEVRWDRAHDEYLARVSWGTGPLTLLVQTRDQRSVRVLTADPRTGETTTVREWSDPAWVELVAGSPTWCAGRLVTVEDRPEIGEAGTRVVCIDGVVSTPADLQVRELLPCGTGAMRGEPLLRVLASPSGDPTRLDVYTFEVDDPEATLRSDTAELAPAIRRLIPGRSGPYPGNAPTIEVTAGLDRAAPQVTVRWSPDDASSPAAHDLEVVAETPVLRAEPRILELGPRRLRSALFLPRDDDGAAPLPVLLDPYGGPHAQRVVAAEVAHLTSQWFADQGFAVLVVDGRGTPGRGPSWERAVHRDLASAVLEDQVDALVAAALIEPRLDTSRVAIRGWSFGGYLAALAVLRRPDVFHAAVAGAPVTDWRLYDTHYTERYLGHPDVEPGAYTVSSLIDGEGRLLGAAPWDPEDPPALLVIHGLADDNVVAAHALRLSSALLADGRPHTFLPLSGVTHMTPQEVVAERLLTRQVDFLHGALGGRVQRQPLRPSSSPRA